MHTGTDFAAPTGTIMASGDGKVTKADVWWWRKLCENKT